jgi:hypothetical protein
MGQLTIPASANEHLAGQTLCVLSGSLDFRVNHQTHHLHAVADEKKPPRFSGAVLIIYLQHQY